MTMPIHGPSDWDDQPEDEAEDLAALGVSVKEAGVEEDLEETLIEEPSIPGATEEAEEPLDALAQLDKLEKELDEPPIEIGDDE
jgi:hypothetical protein